MAGFWSRLFGGGQTPDEAPAATAEPVNTIPKPAEAPPYQQSPEERAAQELAIAQNIARMHIETYRVRLAAPEKYESAIERCFPGDDIIVVGHHDDLGHMMAQTESGEDVGPLPKRGKLIEALRRGDRMTGAAICSISEGDIDKPQTVTLEVTVLPAEYVPLFVETDNQADHPARARSYPVSLVGEQHYQDAIGSLALGNEARIWRESDNPYDDLALVATDMAGRTLGYIPKDSWLRGAIHKEGKGCRATIKDVFRQERGFMGVTLEVEVCPHGEAAAEERAFTGS